MKITKIEAQVKRPGRYSIFVDDKFAFGISELGLINSGLRTGQDVSETELTALKDETKIDKIYNQVLSIIMRRPRSAWEVEDYLKRKGHDQPIRETILNLLSDKKFVNDEDFARRWVENRRLLKNISKRKLALELKQKRIDEETIDQVLAEDEPDEVEVIKTEIEKKRRSSRYQDKTKLIQYLARQGYSYDNIKQALSSD
jgi:regulatory protein